jgi:thiol-disulfide isomerase/thioredoxin
VSQQERSDAMDPIRSVLAIGAATAITLAAIPYARADLVRTPLAASEFTHARPDEWLNSTPLRLADLRGHVVLVDFWTFDCWNCYRSFPWLKALEAHYAARGLRIIGVHSPEFERERDVASVRRKIAEFGLTHPIMLDNDFSYWKAMANRYWPAFYLIDGHGVIRAVFVGETHAGDAQARRIEAVVESLLDELDQAARGR